SIRMALKDKDDMAYIDLKPQAPDNALLTNGTITSGTFELAMKAMAPPEIKHRALAPEEIRNLEDGLNRIENHKNWLREIAPLLYEKKYLPQQYAQRQALDIFVKMPRQLQSALTTFVFAYASALETREEQPAIDALQAAIRLIPKEDHETMRLFDILTDRF